MKRIGRLEVISFVIGFCLLTFELAASRVLAPSIGSSTYVWTSVIGVIIAALSIGYYVGGILADRRNQTQDIAWLLLLGAFAVLFTLVSYQDFLVTATNLVEDTRLQAVIAATILFAPASFVMGALSPYLAKLNVRSLKSAGSSVASLSALNSVGGIAGTFVTGFVLFGFIGARETIAIVALLLVASSWLIVPTLRTGQRLLLTAILGLVIILSIVAPNKTIALDTASAHYEVITAFYGITPIRGLTTGPSGIQSAVAVNGSSKPVFWYTQQLAKETVARKPESILVLGGGAFTLPQYLSEQLPNSKIDVVEIDPGLKGISEKYFDYKNPSNVQLIFDDARSFLNQTDKTYDVVLVDVYGDTSIPFSLITEEYSAALSRTVKQDGVVLANVIAGTVGPCRAILDTVNAAYSKEFKYGSYKTLSKGAVTRANMVLAYTRTAQPLVGFQPLPTLEQMPYNDNYSPAERLYYSCQQVK